MSKKEIRLIEPLLPPLEEVTAYLKEIWAKGWLTNEGDFHERFQNKLCNYLEAPYLSLLCNGTLSLKLAMQALELSGEVITTPFTFVGTVDAIAEAGLKPVFVDVDPDTGCIDAKRIEQALTPFTSAILGVHIFGYPCNTKLLDEIGRKYNLRIIYDAAQAFGVRVNGIPICNFGDISTLSFHATKIFNTAEGGAVVSADSNLIRRINDLRNFGIRSETEIVCEGTNAKMDELRAALGLANLPLVKKAVEARKAVYDYYIQELKGIEGLSFFKHYDNVEYNYSYFPIIIDAEKFGITRDGLYKRLREEGILVRKYFYPLISNLNFYKDCAATSVENLPVANKIADSVLCLPCHHRLTREELYTVSEALKSANR